MRNPRKQLEAPDALRRLTSLPAMLTGPEGPESFASHVARTAAYQVLPLPVTALLARAGVMPTHRLPIGYGMDMSDDHVSSFAHVFGLSEPEVRAMLLRSFDGRAFDMKGFDVNYPQSIRAVTQREWARFGGSTCCPGCLKETRGWRLRWKLWFSFACLTHRVLLVDRCPGCQRPTGKHRAKGAGLTFASLMLKPGFCANPLPLGLAARGAAGRPCGQDLGDVETIHLEHAPRLLAIQRQLYTVLDAGHGTVAGEVVPSLIYFTQLRWLVALILSVGQLVDLGELPTEIFEATRLAFQERDAVKERPSSQQRAAYQPYRSIPSDVRLIAAVLPLACELLAQPDQATAALALRPLSNQLLTVRSNSSGWQLVRRGYLQGVFLAAWNDVMPERANFDRAVGRFAGGREGREFSFLPEQVPPLLWLDVYRQDFASLLKGSGISEVSARAVISMGLVKLCGKYSWEESAMLLGLNRVFSSRSAEKLMPHLKRQGHIDAFQQAIHRVAASLGEQEVPTNFHVRRKALEHFDTISLVEWEAIASGSSLNLRYTPISLRRNIAAWVWTQLTGSDPRLSPALSQDPERKTNLREIYKFFERRYLPDLQVQLELFVEKMKGQL